LVVIRPGDANETIEAWKVAIERRDGPTALLFTRQNVPTLDRNIYAPANGLQKGAYVLADLGEQSPEVILLASGSEVGLIVEAGILLAAEGINIRLVSFPSWELFEMQPIDYQEQVLLPGVSARISVEAGVAQGWKQWVGDRGVSIAIDRYGASAPYQTIYKHYGLTIEAIQNEARRLLAK
jgi:transketolase